jgi:hypothetical protein
MGFKIYDLEEVRYIGAEDRWDVPSAHARFTGVLDHRYTWPMKAEYSDWAGQVYVYVRLFEWTRHQSARTR